jgi:5-methylcytosine-specific restriction endonuclease McrA
MYHKKKRMRRAFERSCGLCAYCERQMRLPLAAGERDMDMATFDHIIPRSKWPGRKTTRSQDGNLALVCRECNEIKSNWLFDEFAFVYAFVGYHLDKVFNPPSPSESAAPRR